MNVRRLSLAVVSITFLASAGSATGGVDVPLVQWQAPLSWSPGPRAGLEADSGRTEQMQAGAEPLALPSALAMFVAIAPCRIVDTRPLFQAAYAPGTPLQPGVTVTFDLNSAPAPCNGIPSNAVAYSINATVVVPSAPGYLSAFPGATPPNPITSLVNYVAGDVIANASVVPGDDNGLVGFQASATLELVVDINGYYVPYTQSVVESLNTLKGDVTVSGGTNVTVAAAGSTVTISAPNVVTAVTPGTGLSSTGSATAPTIYVPAGGIDSALLAGNAVTTAKLQDAAVATAKIADGAVTDAKITSLSYGKLTSLPSRSGEVLQVQTTTLTTNFWKSDTAGNFLEFTSMSITPKSAGSTLIVSISTSVQNTPGSEPSQGCALRIRVNSTTVIAAKMLYIPAAVGPAIHSWYVEGVYQTSSTSPVLLQFELASRAGTQVQSMNTAGSTYDLAKGPGMIKVVEVAP